MTIPFALLKTQKTMSGGFAQAGTARALIFALLYSIGKHNALFAK